MKGLCFASEESRMETFAANEEEQDAKDSTEDG
jgi:hypothetical protein